MAPNKNRKKRLFSIDETPESIFMQFRRPKRNTVIIIALFIFLIIVLSIALNESGLHTKALELAMSIIEAILALFNTGPKSK